MNKLLGSMNTNPAMLGVACIIVGLCIYAIYFFFFRPYETTDNAYVGANYVSVMPQISGEIINTTLVNNQFVNAGDLLFQIDPTPFQIEVARLQANLDLMGNTVREAAAGVNQAEAVLAQTEAQLQDVRVNTVATLRLVEKHALPAINRENAIANLKTAEQAVVAAQAQLEAARQRLGKLGEQNEQIRIATAELDAAKVQLSYTTVYAPYDGQISNCTLVTGQYVNKGTSLFALISGAEFWVDANFKETQLQSMRDGQKAKVEVDMYPGHTFIGEVTGVSGASGVVFSLLPPQNATGNWVKVTQRVPVRIIIKDLDQKYPLRVGTSAYVSVKVK